MLAGVCFKVVVYPGWADRSNRRILFLVCSSRVAPLAECAPRRFHPTEWRVWAVGKPNDVLLSLTDWDEHWQSRVQTVLITNEKFARCGFFFFGCLGFIALVIR